MFNLDYMDKRNEPALYAYFDNCLDLFDFLSDLRTSLLIIYISAEAFFFCILFALLQPWIKWTAILVSAAIMFMSAAFAVIDRRIKNRLGLILWTVNESHMFFGKLDPPEMKSINSKWFTLPFFVIGFTGLAFTVLLLLDILPLM